MKFVCTSNTQVDAQNNNCNAHEVVLKLMACTLLRYSKPYGLYFLEKYSLYFQLVKFELVLHYQFVLEVLFALHLRHVYVNFTRL